MALVDYSSSEDEPDRRPPPSKRRKAGVGAAHTSDATSGGDPARTSGTDANSSRAGTGVSGMPPLPSQFHDLYASTVRQSVVDDPSLHHGRRRQIPHVVGNWPSHLYVECESLGIVPSHVHKANCFRASHHGTACYVGRPHHRH